MQRGFTLVEVIIYIALLAFLLGSGVAASFYIVDSAEKNKSDVNAEAEAHFFLRKIEWALTDVSPGGIALPSSGNSGNVLQTNKNIVGTLRIDSPSGRGRINDIEITNDRVTIQNLNFDHIAAAGAKPEAIHASFTINGKTYETTRYIRK